MSDTKLIMATSPSLAPELEMEELILDFQNQLITQLESLSKELDDRLHEFHSIEQLIQKYEEGSRKIVRLVQSNLTNTGILGSVPKLTALKTWQEFAREISEQEKMRNCCNLIVNNALKVYSSTLTGYKGINEEKFVQIYTLAVSKSLTKLRASLNSLGDRGRIMNEENKLEEMLLSKIESTFKDFQSVFDNRKESVEKEMTRLVIDGLDIYTQNLNSYLNSEGYPNLEKGHEKAREIALVHFERSMKILAGELGEDFVQGKDDALFKDMLVQGMEDRIEYKRKSSSCVIL